MNQPMMSATTELAISKTAKCLASRATKASPTAAATNAITDTKRQTRSQSAPAALSRRQTETRLPAGKSSMSVG